MYGPFELFYCYMYINGKPQFPTTNCFNSAINNVKVKLVLSIIDRYNDGGWYTRYLLHEMCFLSLAGTRKVQRRLPVRGMRKQKPTSGSTTPGSSMG